MATNLIDYETITSMLTTFQNLKDGCESNNNNAMSAFQTFRNSGVNLSNSSYVSSVESTASSVSQNASTLTADYDRLINYLSKLAEAAREAENQSISTIQAREVWNATETVNG